MYHPSPTFWLHDQNIYKTRFLKIKSISTVLKILQFELSEARNLEILKQYPSTTYCSPNLVKIGCFEEADEVQMTEANSKNVTQETQVF